MMPEPCLQFQAVAKAFPGVVALDGVSFDVRAGSVHALLGENGAGKSTLLKILSGAYRPSSGRLCLAGEPCAFHGTIDALAAGIAVIYQELHLVPQLSVAENLFLGHLPHRGGIVDRRRLHELTRQALARLGEDLDPATPVSRLPIGRRQMLEIAKALAHGARVLAFDEPTSSLSVEETRRLFAVIRELRAQGCAILYVTHRLEEVFEICDAATVFRDGRHVCTWDTLAGVTRDQIVKAMVGRDITDVYEYAPRPAGATALEVVGLQGPGLTQPALLRVAAGEIVGLFGLVGAGRSELLKLIYGATRHTTGRVQVGGHALTRHRPADAIAAGLLFCPEDRKKEGIIPVRSVLENLNLSARRLAAHAGFILNGRWEREHAANAIARLGIRTPSPQQLIINLSGGNQQKVILARWLGQEIKAILLDEPTRGIDVGARREIYRIIHDLARRGVAVLFASSDLPEVLGIADRVLVMRQGALVADLPRAAATPERVLEAALPVAG